MGWVLSAAFYVLGGAIAYEATVSEKAGSLGTLDKFLIAFWPIAAIFFVFHRKTT